MSSASSGKLPKLAVFIGWRICVAASGFGPGKFALFALFPLLVGPLFLFDFATPLLERVLILCHLALFVLRMIPAQLPTSSPDGMERRKNALPRDTHGSARMPIGCERRPLPADKYRSSQTNQAREPDVETNSDRDHRRRRHSRRGRRHSRHDHHRRCGSLLAEPRSRSACGHRARCR